MHTTHTTTTTRTALATLAALAMVPAGCHATRASTVPASTVPATVPATAVPAGCAMVDGPVVAALLDAGHAMDYRPDGTWTMDGTVVGHAAAEGSLFHACTTDPATLDAIRSAQP